MTDPDTPRIVGLYETDAAFPQLTHADEALLKRIEAHAIALRGAAGEVAESERTKAAIASAADAVFVGLRPLLAALAGASNPVAGGVVDKVAAAFGAELHRRAKGS